MHTYPCAVSAHIALSEAYLSRPAQTPGPETRILVHVEDICLMHATFIQGRSCSLCISLKSCLTIDAEVYGRVQLWLFERCMNCSSSALSGMEPRSWGMPYSCLPSSALIFVFFSTHSVLLHWQVSKESLQQLHALAEYLHYCGKRAFIRS